MLPVFYNMPPLFDLASSEGLEIMIKRSLLATSIAMALVQQAAATPLLPMDARGLAMGSTGVASAKLAHAPQYNPALLSTANAEDDFAIVLPQIGVVVGDEEEMIDAFDSITNDEYEGSNNGDSIIDHFEGITDRLDKILVSGGGGSVSIEQQLINFENLIANVPGNENSDNSTTAADLTAATTDLNTSAIALTNETQDLEDTTFDLTSELSSISGRAIRGSFGVNGAIAIPSKTFAAAVSVSGAAYFSGRMFFTDNDKSLFNGYAEGINAYAGETQNYTAATQQLATAAENLETCADANPGNPIACSAEATAVDLSSTNAENELANLQSFSYEKDGRTILSTDSTTGDIVIADDLNSNVQIVAVGISEVGLTLSREFIIAGENIAIGITPKLQMIKTFNYVASVDNEEDIEESDVTDTEQDFSTINLDAGAAYQFGASKQWQVGVVAKNLISKEYEAESNPNETTGETTKTTISLDTQFRGGISHTTDWTVIAIDLDLMENDPVAFEAATQYAAIGAELDIFDTIQLRAGYRTNLSVSDSAVASVGLGFSPFGVHVDIAAMANPSDPKKEAGAALELGFYF
jgi:hypothetical protein